MRHVRSHLGQQPRGHYSQAVTTNGFVFVAGQLPLVAGRDDAVPAGIEAQTRQALSNVSRILEAAGSGLDKLVSVTVYVTDIADWPIVNRIYAEILGDHRPARTVAVSPQLHFGCLVEFRPSRSLSPVTITRAVRPAAAAASTAYDHTGVVRDGRNAVSCGRNESDRPPTYSRFGVPA
jgi:2-iminobutanoate/2-iminopropanoate deaminase